MARKKKVILWLIIILGLALRFYGASTTPFSYDENIEFSYAKDISFNSHNPNLPLVVEDNPAPIGHLYLVKAGLYLFGESPTGARLPFIIMGVLTILLVYFFVDLALGGKPALISAFLLSVSQFHIGLTGAFHADAGVVFFSTLSLFVFYKIIQKPNKYFILFNGLVIGIGYLMKENVILMIPIYIIFLAVFPKYRKLLKEKYIWISFCLTLLIVLPDLYLKLSLNVPRVSHVLNIVHLKPSVNSLGIYLGELVLYVAQFFPDHFKKIALTVNAELPAETFVFGIIILAGVVYSIRDKRLFFRLLLVCFLVIFGIFSFIRSVSYVYFIDVFWGLGDLTWPCIGFIPGVILSAYMLSELIKKSKYGKVFFAFLVTFMLVRAVDYVTFPLNAQVPIRYFHIENDVLPRAEKLIEKGNYVAAEDILWRVYKVTDAKPELKQEAAFRLFRISMKKGEEHKK